MLIKPRIQPLQIGENRRFVFLDNVKLPHLRDVSLISLCKDDIGMFETRLIDKNQYILARETFFMSRLSKDMEGFFMKVSSDFRKNGLGEVLRLASIINMFENNLDKINIFSKNSAIFFHSKYKFIPAIKSFDAAKLTLENIASDTQDNSLFFYKRAQELLKLLEESNIVKNKSLGNRVNCFVNEYISNVLLCDKDLYKNRQFSRGFGMVLTKENVIKEKKFFTQLFEKHGIDYDF